MKEALAPPLRLRLDARPRLLTGDRVVHVGSRKAMGLLILLALDGGTSRERLAALLWPEADATVARRNLRREVFRLRELGVRLTEDEDGVLAADAALGREACDATTNGSAPTASAPSLQGLDGIGSAEFDARLEAWRARLAGLRGEELLHKANHFEKHGDKVGALALHVQRWSADACDEAAATDVIRLHAELGQHALALQAYRRLAETLQRELDLAPSTSTRALLREIRDMAGAEAAATGAVMSPSRARVVPATVTPPAKLLPAVIPFVPRAAVERQIEAAWAKGQRVYLHGPPGAGKSRLACELAAARGPWLRVACEPQDAELPYSSVVRLLRALRESAPDVALPDWVRRELSQLMPELGERPQALATDEARQRLLAAAAEAWRQLMHQNFSALVLDDWHWGDPASVELWSRLDDTAPTKTAGGVVWIIGYRSAELPQAALKRQRADLDGRRGVAVALKGMDEREVLALTHALSGAPGGRLFSQRLHDATEGNPFFLLETLRHLFEQGLLSADGDGWSTPFDEQTENYAELPVPPSVRATVLARVRALGTPMQRLLEVASLHSVDIDARLLAAVSELHEEAAIAALEHAQAAHLVQQTATGWRFAHDLVRQALVHGLSPARRRLLHERLARRLELEGATPALVAAHWEAAHRPAAAVRWRIAAAEAALRVHAPNEALVSYAQALADGATGTVAAAIHLACANVHRSRTDRAAADAAFAAAASAAAGDPLAGPAEVLKVQLVRAEHLALTDRIDDCLAALDALVPELAAAPPHLRANALAVRGAALMRRSEFNAAAALLTEAEALFEGLPGSRSELAALLLSLTRCNNWRGDLDAWERYARRAIAVHESLDDPAGLATALSSLGLFHRAMGQMDAAIAVGERARALAARSGNVPVHRNVNFLLLQSHMDAGETDRVLQLLDEGEALAPGFENLYTERNHLAARFYVHFLRGEVEKARAAGDRLLAMTTGKDVSLIRVGFLLIVAELSIDTADWSQARQLIDEAQAAADAHSAGGERHWFEANLALKQATLALAEGRAADAYALLPTAGRDEIDTRFYRAWIGAAAARAQGDTDSARRRIDEVSIDEAAPVHPLVCWLEQRLIQAADDGRADAAATARAETLLTERRVPVLLIKRLRRAIDASPR